MLSSCINSNYSTSLPSIKRSKQWGTQHVASQLRSDPKYDCGGDFMSASHTTYRIVCNQYLTYSKLQFLLEQVLFVAVGSKNTEACFLKARCLERHGLLTSVIDQMNVLDSRTPLISISTLRHTLSNFPDDPLESRRTGCSDLRW